MVVQLGVDARDELFELEDHTLDARLRKRVVVLDRIDELGEAPVRIGLHLREHVRLDLVDVLPAVRPIGWQMARQERHEEWRDQIVDALWGVAQTVQISDEGLPLQRQRAKATASQNRHEAIRQRTCT
eukprot:376379-Prymnesium_polylepis.1